MPGSRTVKCPGCGNRRWYLNEHTETGELTLTCEECDRTLEAAITRTEQQWTYEQALAKFPGHADCLANRLDFAYWHKERCNCPCLNCIGWKVPSE